MRSGVEQYLVEYGPACRARIAKHYDAELNELSFLVEKMKEPLVAFSEEHPSADEGLARVHAYGLVYKAINALVAGFEVALSGYDYEPGILYRHALETCAVAWDIVSNEKSFIKWKGDKAFDSCSSISSLSRVDEEYGALWGLLSNHNVHIRQTNRMPRVRELDNISVLQPLGFIPQGKEELVRLNIESSLIVAHRCLQLVETTFYPYVKNPESVVESTPGKFLVRRVSERHDHFQKAFSRTAASLRERKTD